jgi:agmatine/peptidylarginine deiminase
MLRGARPSVWLLSLALGVAAAVELRSFSSDSRSTFPLRSSTVRPFADYEKTAAVVMAAVETYDSVEARYTIARHLPPGVTLVLYGHDKKPETARKVLDDYGRFLPAERLRYLTLPKARNTIWPRDSMPTPLIGADGSIALAGPRYHGGFEPDRDIAQFLAAPLTEHKFKLDGGNLIANHLGDCFTVEDGESKRISDDMFQVHFGCRSIGRMPRRGGIGHVDERAQFVNAGTILTDHDDYAREFEARGFRTVKLPRLRDWRESYVNSLLVNGVAFVPQFNQPTDAAALDVYRAQGFQAIGVPARNLARKGHGAIHCMTKNYPAAAAPLRW